MNIRSMKSNAIATAMAASCALSAALSATQARANLITNGSFETGDLSGWQLTRNTSPTAGSYIYVVPVNAHEGTYSAIFGSRYYDTISQTLETVAGTSYDISFWAQAYYVAPEPYSRLIFNWDGGAVELDTSEVFYNYTRFTYSLLATSSSTTLSISAGYDIGLMNVDDVVVTAQAGPSTSVPEPGTLALLGAAFMAAAGVRRSKPRA